MLSINANTITCVLLITVHLLLAYFQYTYSTVNCSGCQIALILMIWLKTRQEWFLV